MSPAPLALDSRWLAGASQARLRRRHICQPPQASPASPITHVDGSGTATGLARRKPKELSADDGAAKKLSEDDKKPAWGFKNQSPPRSPRDEPGKPSRSFH
jgi:hypothetical protein